MDLISTVSDWAWARHHNELSWFIRPLIILAFCYAAWTHRFCTVIMLGLFFPLSAVLFPAPETPKPYIVEFLNSERDLLESLSLLGWITFIGAVVLFLWVLAAAFWKRDFWLGVLLANAASIIKLTFSLLVWPDTGYAAVFPTLLTVAVFNLCCLAVWYFILKRKT